MISKCIKLCTSYLNNIHRFDVFHKSSIYVWHGLFASKIQKYLSKRRGRLGFITLLAGSLLLISATTPSRSMQIKEIHTWIQQNGYLPNRPINPSDSYGYQLAITPDLAYSKKRLTKNELSDFVENTDQSDFDRWIGEYSYRFPSSLTVPLANYERRVDCVLRLSLSTDARSYLSNDFDCQEIKNNSPAHFEFDRPIMPGIYQAKILVVKHSSDGFLPSPYSVEDQNGALWLQTITGQREMSIASAFSIWSKSNPTRALGYTFLSILILLFLICYPLRLSMLIGIVFFFFLNLFLISRPFIGHDETAHLETFYKISSTFELSRDDVSLDPNEFLQQAKSKMFTSDFFRLNSAEPIENEPCLHAILGGCGAGKRTVIFYQDMLTLLDFIGLEYHSVDSYFYAAFIYNVFFLVLSLFIVVSFWSIQGLSALLFLLPFYGSMAGQMFTITNDYFLICIGLLNAFSVMILYQKNQTSYLRFIVILAFSLVSLISFSNYDSSAFTLAYPVVLAISVFIAKKLAKLRLMLLVMIGLQVLALTMLFLNWLNFDLLNPYLKSIVGYSFSGSTDVNQNFLSTFIGMIRSIFGSYVWGHSIFPWPAFTAVFGLWLFFIFRSESKLNDALFMMNIILSLALSIYLLDGFFSKKMFDWDSYFKPRFLVGIVPFVFFPFVKEFLVKSQSKVVWGLFVFTIIINLFYIFPKFFLVDAY